LSTEGEVCSRQTHAPDSRAFATSLGIRLWKAIDSAKLRYKMGQVVRDLQREAVAHPDSVCAARALTVMGDILASEFRCESQGYSNAADCFILALTLQGTGWKAVYVQEAVDTIALESMNDQVANEEDLRSTVLRCGRLLFAAGRYADAARVLHTSLQNPCSHQGDDEDVPSVPLAHEGGEGPSDHLGDEFEAEGVLPPLRVRIYVNLGVTLEALGRWQEAHAAYLEAVRLSPRYAAAHKLLGGALLELRRWQEAERSLCRAVELDRTMADAWADLGVARRRLGDVDGAVVAMQLATFHQPNHVLALWGLAHAQRDGGRYFDAAASFQAVAALRPTQWGAHLHAAVCAVLLGKPPGGRERALADMQAAALKMGDDMDVLSALDAMLEAEDVAAASPNSFELLDLAPPIPLGADANRLPLPPEVRRGMEVCANLWTQHTAPSFTLAGLSATMAKWANQWNRESNMGHRLVNGILSMKELKPKGYTITKMAPSSSGGMQVVVALPSNQVKGESSMRIKSKGPEKAELPIVYEPDSTKDKSQGRPPDHVLIDRGIDMPPEANAVERRHYRIGCHIPKLGLFVGCRLPQLALCGK